jgi:hypothetical protein
VKIWALEVMVAVAAMADMVTVEAAVVLAVVLL